MLVEVLFTTSQGEIEIRIESEEEGGKKEKKDLKKVIVLI